MKKTIFVSLLLCACSQLPAQKKNDYTRGIKSYQKDYVANHEVVTGKDKKYFRFFPVDDKFNVLSYFEPITDTVGFTMTTSANTQKHYYKYGRLDFMISGKELILYIYQSKDLMQTEKYKDYLFLPFTDATSGNETYGAGRYLEFSTGDIKGNILHIDFNKAYNPYCTYASGFKCPIPPKENRLPVAIMAGEKNFAKAH